MSQPLKRQLKDNVMSVKPHLQLESQQGIKLTLISLEAHQQEDPHKRPQPPLGSTVGTLTVPCGGQPSSSSLI